MKLPIKTIHLCKEWKLQIVFSLAQWRQLTTILLLQMISTTSNLNSMYMEMYDAIFYRIMYPCFFMYIMVCFSLPHSFSSFKITQCAVRITLYSLGVQSLVLKPHSFVIIVFMQCTSSGSMHLIFLQRMLKVHTSAFKAIKSVHGCFLVSIANE